MATLGDRRGSASAKFLNAENSCVVFDIPSWSRARCPIGRSRVGRHVLRHPRSGTNGFRRCGRSLPNLGLCWTHERWFWSRMLRSRYRNWSSMAYTSRWRSREGFEQIAVVCAQTMHRHAQHQNLVQSLMRCGSVFTCKIRQKIHAIEQRIMRQPGNRCCRRCNINRDDRLMVNLSRWNVSFPIRNPRLTDAALAHLESNSVSLLDAPRSANMVVEGFEWRYILRSDVRTYRT